MAFKDMALTSNETYTSPSFRCDEKIKGVYLLYHLETEGTLHPDDLLVLNLEFSMDKKKWMRLVPHSPLPYEGFTETGETVPCKLCLPLYSCVAEFVRVTAKTDYKNKNPRSDHFKLSVELELTEKDPLDNPLRKDPIIHYPLFY